MSEPTQRTPRVKMVANMAWFVWFRYEAKYDTTTSSAAMIAHSENFAALVSLGLFGVGVVISEFTAKVALCCESG